MTEISKKSETVKIRISVEYDRFVTITGNRNISANKIAKLRDDINSGFNMLQFCPIIVSPQGKNWVIIDGQHRLEASRITGNPVYYVICESISLYQIALLNSCGDKWTVTDFKNAYLTAGIEDYKILRDVANQYQIPVKIASDLLMMFQAKGTSTDAFQTGKFKVQFLDETKELLQLVTELFGRYVFYKDAKLIAAIQKIQKAGKCDFAKLKAKIAAAPMMMDKQGDVKNYVYNIERVYNFKTQNREVLT